MPVVYRHRRLDSNIIFYIGIGKEEKRAYNKNNHRSIFWKNITNKTDYSVEVIAKDISWENACELEVLLIKEYGRKDLGLGELVNLTDGGDGSRGFKRRIPLNYTEEYRKKLSDAQKRKGISKEHRDNINNGFKNMSESSRINMSKTQFKPKKVIDTTTGDIYESIKSLSIDKNISYSSLKRQLSGFFKNKTTYIYYDDTRNEE